MLNVQLCSAVVAAAAAAAANQLLIRRLDCSECISTRLPVWHVCIGCSLCIRTFLRNKERRAVSETAKPLVPMGHRRHLALRLSAGVVIRGYVCLCESVFYLSVSWMHRRILTKPIAVTQYIDQLWHLGDIFKVMGSKVKVTETFSGGGIPSGFLTRTMHLTLFIANVVACCWYSPHDDEYSSNDFLARI